MVLDVSDRDGNVLEQHRIEPHESLRADTAYIMTNLLQGVIQHGTGQRAAPMARRLAARRQDRHDRRLHRRVVHRLRSGHHRRRVGRVRPEEIARVQRRRAPTIALPIWMDIMKPYIARRKSEGGDKPQFTRPNNVVMVMTDKGLEAFIAGTEPGKN